MTDHYDEMAREWCKEHTTGVWDDEDIPSLAALLRSAVEEEQERQRDAVVEILREAVDAPDPVDERNAEVQRVVREKKEWAQSRERSSRDDHAIYAYGMVQSVCDEILKRLGLDKGEPCAQGRD